MADAHEPIRTCIGCRTRAPRGELVRHVLDVAADASTARIVRDERGSAPGRGAWLHEDPSCHELADRRRAFQRALRIPAGIRATLPAHEFEDDHTAAGHVTSPTTQAAERGRPDR